jgi:hypothetical protein
MIGMGGGGGVNKEFWLDFSKIRSGGCGRHVPEDEILAAKTLAPPGIKKSRLLFAVQSKFLLAESIFCVF